MRECVVARVRRRAQAPMIRPGPLHTHRDVCNAVEALSQHFRVWPAPSVVLTRATRSFATRRQLRICRCPSMENDVLHEFAHVLTYVRAPLARAHGPEFCTHLAEAARVWYGDATKYPWRKEYVGVWRWAVRVRLTSPLRPKIFS